MNTRKKGNKCELCNCEVEIPLMVEYFDFCMNCLFNGGRCKECKNGQTLNKLVKLRLKTELIIMNAEVNLSEMEEMRKTLKKKKSSKISKIFYELILTSYKTFGYSVNVISNFIYLTYRGQFSTLSLKHTNEKPHYPIKHP